MNVALYSHFYLKRVFQRLYIEAKSKSEFASTQRNV